MERIVVVANAGAGGAEREALDAALEVLRPRLEVELVETTTVDEVEKLVTALDGRPLIVAGGDGTLHSAINVLHRHGLLEKVPVGLIPLGTGNDFARGTGIPVDPVAAAGLIVAGRVTPVDLVMDDTGLVVINNAHLGVGAQANDQATRWKPTLGRFGYAVGALIAGLRPELPRVRVTVDDREVLPYRRVAQVAIGNGSHVGGGTELIPGADPASGRLTVIVSRPRSWWRRIAYVARLRRGSHYLMKEVERVTGVKTTVAGEEFWVVSDGELAGPHTRRTWTLLPGAVEMFLPE